MSTPTVSYDSNTDLSLGAIPKVKDEDVNRALLELHNALTNAVVDSDAQILTNAANIAAIQETLPLEEVIIASGTTSYTLTGPAVVICNNSSMLELTLNSSPNDLERVYVKRNAGLVKFIGTIDGKVNPTLPFKRDAAHIIYADGVWSLL